MAITNIADELDCEECKNPVPGALADGVHETARRLGIGDTKCRQLIASGELRSVRVGRRLLIPRSAQAEFIDRLLSGEVTS